MDQTFDFRAAPVPFRRRVRPRAIALAVAAAVVLTGVVSFARVVIDSERRSMERVEHAEGATAIVGTISGPDTDDDPGSVSSAFALDGPARAGARTALEAARDVASGRATFLDAGPRQLSAIAGRLIFVDGPSPSPGVVSVAATRQAWAAAVMGSSGTCYWVRYSSGDGATYGTDRVCTGAAALSADDPSW
jgi:hypothetical protein